MQNPFGPVYYGDYLELNKLLDTQHPVSKKLNNEAHDEMLFIIVHQVYELWFKQIRHEFLSINNIFAQPNVHDSQLASVVARLERVKKIQSLLLTQLEVMETMTPMDFLEFRDLLVPASGFQSVQFREIEIMLGLKTNQRKEVDREYFLGRLNKEDQDKLLQLESSPTFFDNLMTWLERMPFTYSEQFDFWTEFKDSVEDMICGDELIISENAAALTGKALEIQKANIALTRNTFENLFDEEKFNKLVESGDKKFTWKATINSLFILLYRDQPAMSQPYKILELLMDIDENFTTWRYRHALMAQRMLGTKIGTGGSSGHEYLKRAADNNRSFVDIFNLSTFIVPRSKRPVLPEDIQSKLNFNY